MRRRPYLWSYAVMPLLLNVLITAAILALLLLVAAGFVYWMHPWFTGWSGAWSYLSVAVEILAVVALAVVCLAVAVVTWRILTGVLCGTFYGKLAAAVERELGMPADELQEISFSHEMIDTVIDFAWLLIVLVVSLLLTLVPLVGAPVALVYTLWSQCFICGRDQLSYPLSLRGRRRHERAEFARTHRPHTMGLGAVVMLLGFIPIFGAIVLTTAVSGAVILHRRLQLAES